MVSAVAGLEIGEPGYREILFKPRPGGTITWAEARLRLSHGEVAIRWELKDKELHLDLIVPPQCRATLSLPPGWQTSTPAGLDPGSHKIIARRTEAL
jgi:alpha-L-rhamnosidase